MDNQLVLQVLLGSLKNVGQSARILPRPDADELKELERAVVPLPLCITVEGDEVRVTRQG